MTYFITLLLAIMLMSISLLHFYWIAGGKWGFIAAIPEKFAFQDLEQRKSLKFRFATFIVAIGLIVFAIIIGSNTFEFLEFVPSKITKWGTSIIGVIFLIRAIGDFNMVGLFKKRTDHIFSKSDDKIFIPICLVLGLGSLMLVFLS